MTSQLCVADDCGRPTDTNLCADCLRTLRGCLNSIAQGRETVRTWTNSKGEVQIVRGHAPGLVEDLQVTVTRQHVAGKQGGGRSKPGSTVPFHIAASDVAFELDSLVASWARDLADHTGVPLIATTTVEAAVWLADLGPRLAGHPAAGDLFEELVGIVRRGERVIDQQQERVYLGPCGVFFDGEDPCGESLYGVLSQRFVACKGCGVEHEAFERWEALRVKVRAAAISLEEIAEAAVRVFDRPLNVKTLRSWSRRGHIVSLGRRGGEFVYNVGHVLDVAEKRLQKAA